MKINAFGIISLDTSQNMDHHYFPVFGVDDIDHHSLGTHHLLVSTIPGRLYIKLSSRPSPSGPFLPLPLAENRNKSACYFKLF